MACIQEAAEHKLKATQLESELADTKMMIKYKEQELSRLEKEKQQLFKKIMDSKHDDTHSENIFCLGNGRFGTTSKNVFKNKLFAVKILHKKLLERSQFVVDLVAEFKGKCDTCFGLDHTNLVRLVDITEVNKQVAIVSELMQLNLCGYPYIE